MGLDPITTMSMWPEGDCGLWWMVLAADQYNNWDTLKGAANYKLFCPSSDQTTNVDRFRIMGPSSHPHVRTVINVIEVRETRDEETIYVLHRHRVLFAGHCKGSFIYLFASLFEDMSQSRL